MKESDSESEFSWDKIDVLSVSQESLEKEEYSQSKEDIFFVRSGEGASSHGPFLLSRIKEYLLESSHWEQFSIRPLEADYWIPIGQHPLFDRREETAEKVLKSVLSHQKNLYLNSKGQRVGPYSLEEIQKILEDQEIYLTDLVGTDNGRHWVHLFELQNLDRRKSHYQNLPDCPDWGIFKNSNKEVDKIVQKKEEGKEEKINPMAVLAYLKKVKSKKKSDSKTAKGIQSVLTGQENSYAGKKGFKNPLAIGILLFFLLIGGIAIPTFFLSSDRTDKKKSLGDKIGKSRSYRPSSPRKKVKRKKSFSSSLSKSKARRTSLKKKKKSTTSQTQRKLRPKRNVVKSPEEAFERRRWQEERLRKRREYDDDYGTFDNPIELNPVYREYPLPERDSFEEDFRSLKKRYREGEEIIDDEYGEEDDITREPSSILDGQLQEVYMEYYDEEVEL